MKKLPDNIKNNKSFCVLPFIHFSNRPKGTIRLCCEAEGAPDWTKNDGTPFKLGEDDFVNDAWNSDYIKSIRQKMVNGEHVSECSKRCYKQEALGHKSKRIRANESWLKKDHIQNQIVNTIENNMHSSELPKFIDLKLGNLCNMSCRMCTSTSSSKFLSDLKHMDNINSHYDNDIISGSKISNWWEEPQFENNLDILIKNTDVIYTTGGEPLLNKKLFKVINEIPNDIAQNIKFWITTNLQLIDDKWITIFSKFKEVAITASIDGIEDKFEYIRQHGRWNTIIQNLDMLDKLDNIIIDMSFTYQLMTLDTYSDLLDFAIMKRNQTNKTYKILPVILTYPLWFKTSIIPKSMADYYIDQLKACLSRDITEHDKNTINVFINDLSKSNNDPKLLEEFKKLTDIMDKHYGKSFKDVFPVPYSFLY